MYLQQQLLKAIAHIDARVEELEKKVGRMQEEMTHDRTVMVQTLANLQQQVDALVKQLKDKENGQ